MTHIGIIGYGSQAKAFAHNLRDSGLEISILLRSTSKNISLAKTDLFNVIPYDSELLHINFQFLIVLTPDDTHGKIISELSKKNQGQNICFLFAHGYSFLKENLKEKFPHHSFGLLAPKAIASELRGRYSLKEKLVGVIDSSHCYDKKDELFQLATLLGLTQLIESTFKDEAQADLFSEQTLLCSLLPYGALKSYEFLIAKGIDPNLAFVECWMEVKLIADAMLSHGPVGYLNLISENAFAGGEKAQQLIFDDSYQKKMDSLWNDIEKGSFFSEIDAMNMTALKEQVLEKWGQHSIQKSYENYMDIENKNESINHKKNSTT